MPTAMAIIPHADDAAAFCGGTLAKLAHQGWRVILVRVTDDCKDSLGLTREETVRRNRAQLHEAARILGAAEVIELGYETDCLADASEPALRERIVYLLRKHRPYAVFSLAFSSTRPRMSLCPCSSRPSVRRSASTTLR